MPTYTITLEVYVEDRDTSALSEAVGADTDVLAPGMAAQLVAQHLYDEINIKTSRIGFLDTEPFWVFIEDAEVTEVKQR